MRIVSKFHDYCGFFSSEPLYVIDFRSQFPEIRKKEFPAGKCADKR